MMPTQQAELEQVAREFLRDTLGLPVVAWEDIHATMNLIAAQRAKVLEEAADEMARHPYWSKEAEVWITHLRQQAKEQRPCASG